MEKICLDTLTERVLLNRLQELRMIIPYDVFVCIDAIIQEAVSQHYIYRHKIEEILTLLQELETKSNSNDKGESVQVSKAAVTNCIIHKNERQDPYYYQKYDFDVTKFKRIFDMMLAEPIEAKEKIKTKGMTF